MKLSRQNFDRYRDSDSETTTFNARFIGNRPTNYSIGKGRGTAKVLRQGNRHWDSSVETTSMDSGDRHWDSNDETMPNNSGKQYNGYDAKIMSTNSGDRHWDSNVETTSTMHSSTDNADAPLQLYTTVDTEETLQHNTTVYCCSRLVPEW